MDHTLSERKSDHIRICMEEDVRGDGITTGLERYRLVHCALPEMALADVVLGFHLWGKRLRAPFLISQGLVYGLAEDRYPSSWPSSPAKL